MAISDNYLPICSPSAPPPLAEQAKVQADPITTPKSQVSTSPSLGITHEFQSRIGNSADYSRLTGQLVHIHAGEGFWILRYAPIDRVDRYGGSVVLDSATNLESFREGDLVVVSGEIVGDSPANPHTAAPLYRVTKMRLEERARR